jgi:hypothetical protein
MNDYVRGALEALTWARTVLEDQQGDPKSAIEEIEGALKDINAGVAVNFRERLKQR